VTLSLRVQTLISLTLVASILTAALAARGHGHGHELVGDARVAQEANAESGSELRPAPKCSCCRHTPPPADRDEDDPQRDDNPPLEDDCALCAGFRLLSSATPVQLALPELPRLVIAWRKLPANPAIPQPWRFRGAASRAPPLLVIA
jgi:hypothetical protein